MRAGVRPGSACGSRRPLGLPGGTDLHRLQLDVELEIMLPMRAWHFRVRKKNLSNAIRVLIGDRLTLAKPTGVVIQFGQPKNIGSHLDQIHFAMLNRNGQRNGNLPPIVGRNSWLEATGKQEAVPFGSLPKRAAKNRVLSLTGRFGMIVVPEESGNKSVGILVPLLSAKPTTEIMAKVIPHSFAISSGALFDRPPSGSLGFLATPSVADHLNSEHLWMGTRIAARASRRWPRDPVHDASIVQVTQA